MPAMDAPGNVAVDTQHSAVCEGLVGSIQRAYGGEGQKVCFLSIVTLADVAGSFPIFFFLCGHTGSLSCKRPLVCFTALVGAEVRIGVGGQRVLGCWHGGLDLQLSQRQQCELFLFLTFNKQLYAGGVKPLLVLDDFH